MRDARVDGSMPSSFAAPPGPETSPLVCFKALTMASRSCRFSSSCVGSVTFTSGFVCWAIFSCGRDAGKSKVSGPLPPDYDRALDSVLKFAHVAGPVVGCE